MNDPTSDDQPSRRGAQQTSQPADPQATVTYRPTAPAPGSERMGLPTCVGFEVEGVLGRGGMGVVYKAKHIALKRTVAIKMLLSAGHAGPGELARFRVEAEAAARLHHPNIVQIHEVGAVEGRPFCVLEYVDGGSLARRLRGGPLPPPDAARLVETLAAAMHVAHSRDIVHRDLKPANILLTTDGVPKITDFGLARRLDVDGGQTQTGSVLGTPSYMAPEQAAGDAKEIGPPADVYALGAILYECMTGKPPFMGDGVLKTLELVRTREPTAPRRLRPRIPRDLETICLKCLRKAPQRRYGSAEALADDLRRWRVGEPIGARPVGRAEQAWRCLRRNPVPAGLLLTAILGSALGTWGLSRLSQGLARTTALAGARQQATMYNEHGNLAGQSNPTGDLRVSIGEDSPTSDQTVTRRRLYSDQPFRNRTNGGVKTAFEREALERLREDASADKEYFRFDQDDGRPVLHYAVARAMTERCIACHNANPDSSRQDWRVGEVAGVLELTRPLDGDEKVVRQTLSGAFILLGCAATALVLISALTLFLGNRRRR